MSTTSPRAALLAILLAPLAACGGGDSRSTQGDKPAVVGERIQDQGAPGEAGGAPQDPAGQDAPSPDAPPPEAP